MALRLENILLRGRALPPGDSPADSKSEISMEELIQALAALRQEVEVLRQRLEQVEQQNNRNAKIEKREV